MLLQDYLKEISGLSEKGSLNSTRSKLLKLIPQQKFDELSTKMKVYSNWEESCLIKEIRNHGEAASMFRNYSETYAGRYGLTNKIISFIASKSDTVPGDVVFDYIKDKDGAFAPYEDGSHVVSATFHPNHSLIWMVTTNNVVFGKPDETYYGEGIKYIIYVYTPSDEVRENCLLIKQKKALQNKGIYEQISVIEKETAKRIAKLKEEAGIID